MQEITMKGVIVRKIVSCDQVLIASGAQLRMSRTTSNESIIQKQKDRFKIRCGKCNLPFLSKEQLQKHASTHERKKSFTCMHCQKGFVRADRCKLHTRSCESNPEKKTHKTSAVQIGLGANTEFRFLESALGGVYQAWRYEFSNEDQKDMLQSLHSVIMEQARDLVIKATGVFKWYLGLKVLFHKAADPWHETDPPPFFQTDPSESYRRNQEDVWEITKENLEQQIENYERNGSGWVLSQLLSIDVIFCEMDAKI